MAQKAGAGVDWDCLGRKTGHPPRRIPIVSYIAVLETVIMALSPGRVPLPIGLGLSLGEAVLAPLSRILETNPMEA